jgi:hypothetical protein
LPAHPFSLRPAQPPPPTTVTAAAVAAALLFAPELAVAVAEEHIRLLPAPDLRAYVGMMIRYIHVGSRHLYIVPPIKLVGRGPVHPSAHTHTYPYIQTCVYMCICAYMKKIYLEDLAMGLEGAPNGEEAQGRDLSGLMYVFGSVQ